MKLYKNCIDICYEDVGYRAICFNGHAFCYGNVKLFDTKDFHVDFHESDELFSSFFIDELQNLLNDELLLDKFGRSIFYYS